MVARWRERHSAAPAHCAGSSRVHRPAFDPLGTRALREGDERPRLVAGLWQVSRPVSVFNGHGDSRGRGGAASGFTTLTGADVPNGAEHADPIVAGVASAEASPNESYLFKILARKALP